MPLEDERKKRLKPCRTHIIVGISKLARHTDLEATATVIYLSSVAPSVSRRMYSYILGLRLIRVHVGITM